MSSATTVPQLDVVEHPTLGTLKFPKDMPFEERNASIERLSDPLRTGAGMMKPAPAPKLPEQPQQIFDMTQSPLATASKDIGAGNYAKGTHTILSALGRAAQPLVLPAAAVAGPAATAGGLVGSMALGYGGKFGGEALGLTPDQSDVAGDIGGLVGGIAGGMAPRLNNSLASLMRNPATATQAAMGRPGTVKPFVRSPIPILPKALQLNIPEWLIPKGDVGAPTNPGAFRNIPSTMPKPQPDALALAVKEGIANKIPTTMPKPLDPFAKGPNVPLSESPYATQNAAARSFAEGKGGPSNLLSQSPNRLAITPVTGSQIAADEPVLHLPEPAPLAKGEKPGSMYSVNRKEVLLPAAQRGKAGAGDVLRDIGKTILYEPREGTGYPGPRPTSSVKELPQGNPTPFKLPEFASASRPALVESTQASEMTPQQASKVVRDPRATTEELVAAWRVLRGKK